MAKGNDDTKLLIAQAIRLTALGYDMEHKRDIVRRMSEISMEPSMEFLRAIDDFLVTKMEFEELEREHLTLRNKVAIAKK